MKRAVLFLVFNRLDTTQKVFEQIKIAQPPRLYLASDGARINKQGEEKIVDEVRNWVLGNIDWDCEVKTKFNETNLGCGKAVSSAITWFFEQEEMGIILEDDCLPDQSFFYFCEELLGKYKDDKRVWHISGNQFVKDFDNEFSYYFSKIQHCWGWATWADRWQKYKFDLNDYDEKYIENFSEKEYIQSYWNNILKKLKAHEIDTWDYQWTFEIIKQNGFCINPNKNTVSNIGIEGLHYKNAQANPLLNIQSHNISTINHPEKIKFDKGAIDYIYHEIFNIKKV